MADVRVLLLTPCGEELDMTIPSEFRIMGVHLPDPVRYGALRLEGGRTVLATEIAELPRLRQTRTYKRSGLYRIVEGERVEVWTVDGYGEDLDGETAKLLGFRPSGDAR